MKPVLAGFLLLIPLTTIFGAAPQTTANPSPQATQAQQAPASAPTQEAPLPQTPVIPLPINPEQHTPQQPTVNPPQAGPGQIANGSRLLAGSLRLSSTITRPCVSRMTGPGGTNSMRKSKSSARAVCRRWASSKSATVRSATSWRSCMCACASPMEPSLRRRSLPSRTSPCRMRRCTPTITRSTSACRRCARETSWNTSSSAPLRLRSPRDSSGPASTFPTRASSSTSSWRSTFPRDGRSS